MINNAGYTLMGDTEAAGDKESRDVFDVNFWGLVNVTKEAVRVFREVNGKGVGGLVVQVTTLGAWVGFPGNAFYHARYDMSLPYHSHSSTSTEGIKELMLTFS